MGHPRGLTLDVDRYGESDPLLVPRRVGGGGGRAEPPDRGRVAADSLHQAAWHAWQRERERERERERWRCPRVEFQFRFKAVCTLQL